MKRKIISVTANTTIGFINKTNFTLGERINIENGNVFEVTGINRYIGGLADISSIGPSALGPNCPTLVAKLERLVLENDEDNINEDNIDDEPIYIAIPERIVTSIIFKDVKNKEIQMTKEG